MSLDPIFFALSDPTRRRVLKTIRFQPSAVGKIAEHFPVSRPAVSQHLKILKDAGLVTEERRGTRNIYSVDPAGIAAMQDYFNTYWEIPLDRFKAYAEQIDPNVESKNSNAVKGEDK